MRTLGKASPLFLRSIGFFIPRPQALLRDEKGSALIMSIVVMVIVAIVGTIGANTTISDSNNTLVFRKGSEGLYAGESGIQRCSSRYRGMKFDDILSQTTVISTPSEFGWPDETGSDPNWDNLDSPPSTFQGYMPSVPRAGRGRSKMASELGASARIGQSPAGLSNAMLETSRICVRSEGFSVNPQARVRTQLEQQMITYLPVQE